MQTRGCSQTPQSEPLNGLSGPPPGRGEQEPDPAGLTEAVSAQRRSPPTASATTVVSCNDRRPRPRSAKTPERDEEEGGRNPTSC